MATEKNFRVKKGLEVQGPSTLNDSATITGNVTISGSGTLTVGGSTVSKVEIPALRDSNNGVVLSDGVTALAIRSAIGAASAAASGGLDSAGIVSFVDSSYINHRLPAGGVQLPFRTKQFQFISTAGQLEYTGNDIAGNALSFASDRFNVFYNGLLLPDSDFTTAGNNTLTLADSAEAGDIITVVTYEAANGIDSAEAIKLNPKFGTDYVDSGAVNTLIDGRVNATFINNLTIDADTLGGQAGSYYLNYNNFSNTPTIPTLGGDFVDSAYVTSVTPTLGGDFVDSAIVSSLITSTVTSGYIQTRQGLIDSNLVTQLVDSAYVALRDKFNDSAGVLQFVDSDYVQARQDKTYSSLTGAPTIPTLGGDFIDSAAALILIDANSLDSNRGLAKTGGTMSGNINMGGANIVNVERLGIGTASPTSGLHVIDSVGTYGQVRISDGTSNVWHRTDSSEYRIDWFSSVARKINLLNSGSGSISVGINTPSPTQTLDVAGTLNVTGATTLGSTLNGHTVPGGTGTLALTSNIPTLGGSFVDSDEVLTLIDSAYINARTSAGTDSATTIALIDEHALDSGRATDLIDSAYISARVGGNSLTVTYTPDAKYARLTMSSDQSSISSTTALTTFNTRSIDTSPSNALTSTLGDGKFIIPAGVTKVRLRGSVTTSSVTDQVVMDIRKNGSVTVGSTNFDISSTGRDHAAAYTGIIDVVENDYFQLFMFSSNSRTAEADEYSWFEIEVVEGSMLNTVIASTFSYLDSAKAIDLIDSNYVQTRQDKAYGSLTGAPTIPTLGGDFVDSAFVTGLGYITASSSDTLTNKSGNISMFTNDANYLDSTTTSALIDSDYIELRRPPEAVFTVVNSGSSAYAFTGDGFSSSANNPTLYLQRGLTYKFSVSASGHPFQIRVSSGGSAYNTGVTNNGVQSGTLLFTPDMSAPNTLVYQCTAHSGMVGNIIIVDDNTFVDSARVSSIITADVDATFINNLTIDADTLGGQAGSYYLAYGNFTGTPTIPTIGNDFIDSAIANTLANARIAASDLSALNNVHTTTPTHDQILKWDSGNQYWYPADSSSAGGGGISGITVQEEGSSLSTVGTILNFVGSNVTASGTGATKTITITGGSGGLDSALTTQLIDSAYVQLRQSASGGGVDSAATIALIDSSYVQARQAAGAGFTVQDEGSSLSTLATTLNFTGAGVTATGTGASKTINIPGGSATGSFQSDRITITEFTADSGQTTFTGLDYTVGKTQVFLNGIQLVNTSDYTATNGSSIVLGAGADSGNTLTVVSHKLQDQLFTAATNISNYFYTNTLVADSSVTTFGGADDAGNTLSYTPGKLQVYLNGIYLKDSDDYTATSGTNIVLTQAADSDDVLSIVTYITENTTGGATRIDNFYYTADSGQTAFTGADDDGNTLSYVADRLQVYLNGILLRDSADYTATNGTTITLLEGTDSADILTVSAFTTKSTSTFDSDGVIGFIDSAYVQLRQDKAYSSLTGAPTIPTLGGDFVDSAATNTLIDARVNATFINNLTIDADTLGGQNSAYHLAYANFTGTPTIPTLGGDFVDSAYVLANSVDSAEVVALVDSAYVQLRQSGGAITVQEEGSSLSTSATTLNFVGSNVTASGTGATKTITITGSSGTDSAQVDLLIDAKLATTDVTDLIGADGQANQVLKSLGDGNVEWTNLRIPEFTPTSSTTVGTRGEITFDSSYLYVAVATNNWNRIAWTDSSW